MRRRGPPPKSAALRRAQGNPSKRPFVEEGTTVASALAAMTIEKEPASFQPPDWLILGEPQDESSRRRLARAGDIWDTARAELMRLNLLKAGDEIPLGRYCRYMAEWMDLSAEIDRNGFERETRNVKGDSKFDLATAFRARSTLETELRSLEDRLGLSPQARTALLKQLAQRLPMQSTNEKRRGSPERGHCDSHGSVVGFLKRRPAGPCDSA